MNRYYINGTEVPEAIARDAYFRHWAFDVYGAADGARQWQACQCSEESRDALLPAHIEIVQGE